MAEIRFYHLVRTSLDRALPPMLAKTLERGGRAVVMAGSEERVEALAEHLWTHDPASFLPHGSARDGAAENQPIWLTDRDEAPNGAQSLFLLDGAMTDSPDRFALICLLFDGTDESAVVAARRHWTQLRAAGHTLAYWRQDESGRWSEAQRVEGAGEGRAP